LGQILHGDLTGGSVAAKGMHKRWRARVRWPIRTLVACSLQARPARRWPAGGRWATGSITCLYETRDVGIALLGLACDTTVDGHARHYPVTKKASKWSSVSHDHSS